MKRLKFLSALFFSVLLLPSASAQDEPDKIGTVSMQKLLGEFYKTKQTVELFKGYKETVVKQNETRLEAIKALITKTRELQAEAENSSLSKEKQEELFRKVASQRREAQALQNERMDWLNRKNAAFAEKQKVDLGILREEIVKMVHELGEAQGYDFIFDSSGASGGNVLIMAYAKDATDLTGVMIERINKDAPEEGAGEPTEEKESE